MTRQTAQPKAGTHLFVPDPDLPPDTNGRHVCLSCHLVGAPDDPHHHLPTVPEQAEHQRRYESEGN